MGWGLEFRVLGLGFRVWCCTVLVHMPLQRAKLNLHMMFNLA